MDEELKDLIAQQEILRGMKASCQDFEQKLNEKIGQFCKEHLKIEDATFSILDIVAKVRSLD